MEMISSSELFPIALCTSLIVVNFKLGLVLTLFLFLGFIAAI